MEVRWVTTFDWTAAGDSLATFGGELVTLHVPKTGLPFFDALRLYGAIDLYIGVREDVTIIDAGNEWAVEAKSRNNRVAGADQAAFAYVWKKRKPLAPEYCDRLRNGIVNRVPFAGDPHIAATKALSGLDSALQAGIRDSAATSYTTLQTGQTSESTCCVAKIPLSSGLLAFAGKKRVEGIGSITFLPIFEGKVDLSKVVSPLRAWLGVPHLLCAQALAVLTLKTSLFAEGYQERLKGVVFNTALGGRRSDNYSGFVAVGSTAIGKMGSADFCAHVHHVFRELVASAWKRQGRDYAVTALTPAALALGFWLMQPVPKHLSSMITAQEQLHRSGLPGIFLANTDYVQEVFRMTYGTWKGDHDATRRFARAVASSIYYARMVKEKDAQGRQKAWYDEVTMLRSSPSAKAFIERAMILIEQGHREHAQIGTAHRNEAFDPDALLKSIGLDRAEFETFRDLFRMYLVQESTWRQGEKPTVELGTEIDAASADASETEEEDEE